MVLSSLTSYVLKKEETTVETSRVRDVSWFVRVEHRVRVDESYFREKENLDAREHDEWKGLRGRFCISTIKKRGTRGEGEGAQKKKKKTKKKDKKRQKKKKTKNKRSRRRSRS